MFLGARIRFSMANCCATVALFELLEQTKQGCIHKFETVTFQSIP